MPLKCPYCDIKLETLDSALYHVDCMHTIYPHRWATIKYLWQQGMWDLIYKEALTSQGAKSITNVESGKVYEV